MKKLLIEYWQEFDVRYIKKIYAESIPLLYFVIYWNLGIFSRNTIWTDITAVTEKIILEAAVFVPFVLVCISYAMHPVSLSKQMYLCPMSSQERGSLIVRKYRFRVGLHMTVCIAGTVLAAVMTRGAFCWYLLMLWNDFAVCTFIPSEQENTGSRVKERIYKNIMLLAVPVCNIVYLEMAVHKAGVNKLSLAVIAGMILLIQLPLLIWYGKCVKRHLCAAQFYTTNIDAGSRIV